jgi:hypothetical protein
MTASTNETLRAGEPQERPDLRLLAGPGRGAEITDLEKVRADRLTAAAPRRAAARTRNLTVLLRDRPDLVGVHAPADFAVDALRWSV